MDQVIFVANATGGVSSLRYSWDFDASNGIQEESTGKVGQFVYTQGRRLHRHADRQRR